MKLALASTRAIGSILVAGLAFTTSDACAQAVPATGDLVAPQPSIVPNAGTDNNADRQVFEPADFARFVPRSAFDMLVRVPGFTFRDNEQQRGFGQASGNVLFNGERPSSKSDTLQVQLGRIPADTVLRIEILDGATLDIPGLSGQVANIVYRADATSGQFAWRPEFRARFTDPLFTRGDISVSGRRGPVEYQLGLDNDGANRGGAGGLTQVFDRDGAWIERRDEVVTSNADTPRLGVRLTIDAPGDAIANLNGHYQRIVRRNREDALRIGGGLPDRDRTVLNRTDGWNYEIGGDYEFGLVEGRLKLIGLRREGREPNEVTIVARPTDGSPPSGERLAQTALTAETIGRGEFGWRMLGGQWELSAEAAFNRLDNVATLGVLLPGGGFDERPFARATGVVEEDRYEALLSYGRGLLPGVTMQLIAGAEHSTIVQTGTFGLTRSFLRPKGSLSLSWAASPKFDLSVQLRRRVLQLAFRDFLGRAFLNDGTENAGNVELRPQQDWSVEVEANRRFGAWGSSKLRLVYRDVTDYVDIVPVGGGQSTGNIASAWIGLIDWTSTVQFDPIGWRGARLETHVLIQRTGLRDPFTGERRPWSGVTDRSARVSLRHDIPGGDWAYGGDVNYARVGPSFRGNEIDLVFEGPTFVSFFIENKDVAGLTLRAQIGNLLDARVRRERAVFTGLRGGSPLAFRESRDWLIGPIFSFQVRGTF